VGWIDQLEAQLPSLTFRVTVDGQSRTEGQVFIDGRLRPELASGKAIELDPGKHHLRFVLEGVKPYEEEFISSEGERYRMLEVALVSIATATATENTSRADTHRTETHRPVPLGTYVLGGVAVAAALSGGIWGAASLSLRRELEDTCAPACPERRVDELRQRALITDLSWGVSALALVGATCASTPFEILELPTVVTSRFARLATARSPPRAGWTRRTAPFRRWTAPRPVRCCWY
jgi:hypothetical protein